MTLVLYGQEADGTDKTELLKYTVSDGKASVTYNGKTIETTPIADNTFTASLDGTDATKCSFSTTKGTKLPTSTPPAPDTPTDPDIPEAEIKTAVQLKGCFGDFDLQWTDGVAVVEKEFDSSYTDTWNSNTKEPELTISFALLTEKDKWEMPCYKESTFNFGEEVDLKIASGGNNVVTSEDSLAGKKIRLTFTGTKTTIKCKAEIVK